MQPTCRHKVLEKSRWLDPTARNRWWHIIDRCDFALLRTTWRHGNRHLSLTMSYRYQLPVTANDARIYNNKYKCTIDQELADAAAYRRRQTLRVYSPGGITFPREMTSWPPSWKCVGKSKIRLIQSMRIYLKNNPAKFHPNPLWNDEALGFLKSSSPTRRTRWIATWDQFLD